MVEESGMIISLPPSSSAHPASPAPVAAASSGVRDAFHESGMSVHETMSEERTQVLQQPHHHPTEQDEGQDRKAGTEGEGETDEEEDYIRLIQEQLRLHRERKERIRNFLHRNSVFRQLTENCFQECVDEFEQSIWSSGKTILRRGEAWDKYSLILDGRLRLEYPEGAAPPEEEDVRDGHRSVLRHTCVCVCGSETAMVSAGDDGGKREKKTQEGREREDGTVMRMAMTKDTPAHAETASAGAAEGRVDVLEEISSSSSSEPSSVPLQQAGMGKSTTAGEASIHDLSHPHPGHLSQTEDPSHPASSSAAPPSAEAAVEDCDCHLHETGGTGEAEEEGDSDDEDESELMFLESEDTLFIFDRNVLGSPMAAAQDSPAETLSEEWGRPECLECCRCDSSGRGTDAPSRFRWLGPGDVLGAQTIIQPIDAASFTAVAVSTEDFPEAFRKSQSTTGDHDDGGEEKDGKMISDSHPSSPSSSSSSSAPVQSAPHVQDVEAQVSGSTDRKDEANEEEKKEVEAEEEEPENFVEAWTIDGPLLRWMIAEANKQAFLRAQALSLGGKNVSDKEFLKEEEEEKERKVGYDPSAHRILPLLLRTDSGSSTSSSNHLGRTESGTFSDFSDF